MKHLSITYIPRNINKEYISSYMLDSNTIYLKQDFLDNVEEDFLQIMLSDAIRDLVPIHVIDAVLAYSDQRDLDKDVTVVFDY